MPPSGEAYCSPKTGLKTGSTKTTHFLFVFQNYQNLNGHLSHGQNINVIIYTFSEKKVEYGAMA